jgi:hydroxymethylpyrimidine/phosphomethylpyrimidine kinase
MRKSERGKPIALTIAGSDPGGGAGLQADLKTFAALKVYGYSAVTAVIAQNSAMVRRVAPVDAALVADQIETVVAEAKPDALKTGALADASVVHAVAETIRALDLPAPVVDPVMISSSGVRLLEADAEEVLRTQLLPLARIVTPNIPEAETFAAIAIDGVGAMREAAASIRRMGPQAVVIKGGHRFDTRPASGPSALKARTLETIADAILDPDGPPAARGRGRATRPARSRDRFASEAIDLFYDGRNYVELRGERVAGGGAHGTGCAFSAAIAAFLARGMELEEAVRSAKAFVARALRSSFRLGGGGRSLLDHFAGK